MVSYSPNFIVASTGNITLKIDPAVVLATREYVEQRIMEELYKLDNKQSVRVATTANIALAGVQTIDGVVLVAAMPMPMPMLTPTPTPTLMPMPMPISLIRSIPPPSP
ncbi:hypothetical protein B5P22_31220 [Pseudomonas tolaasii]|nr:hypothetical protein B5P22_31220 [Pseudomonas tolaasii]